MNRLKKEYWLLGVAIVPFISLHLQYTMPKLINRWQMEFTCINLICAILIILFSIRNIFKKNENLYIFEKIIVSFGLIYTILILLPVCSMIISIIEI